MIPVLVSSLVLAVVAGAWALLESRDPGVESDDGGCGPACSCRRRETCDRTGDPRPAAR